LKGLSWLVFWSFFHTHNVVNPLHSCLSLPPRGCVSEYLKLSHLCFFFSIVPIQYISFTSRNLIFFSLFLSLRPLSQFTASIYNQGPIFSSGSSPLFSLSLLLFIFPSPLFDGGDKMKCFFFKEKCKSAPELHKKKNPAVNRAANSTGSLSSPKSVKDLYREKEHSFRVFTFQELRDATQGFNRTLKLGEGGFGSVYKGSIRPSDGQGDQFPVAIKRLNTRGFQVYTCFFFHPQFLFFFCFSWKITRSRDHYYSLFIAIVNFYCLTLVNFILLIVGHSFIICPTVISWRKNFMLWDPKLILHNSLQLCSASTRIFFYKKNSYEIFATALLSGWCIQSQITISAFDINDPEAQQILDVLLLFLWL